MKSHKSSGIMYTPLTTIIAVAAVVLVAELLLMTLFHEYLMVQLGLSPTAWGFIDAILLALIIAPALYLLVFRELQQSEARIRQINAAAQDAIVIVDAQGGITSWNPAAQRLFQYRAEEALGQRLHRLIVPPRLQADADRGFAHFVKTGEGPVIGKTIEIVALRKDGSEFPIELSISALKINSHWQAIGIARDITERRQTEQKLSDSEKLYRSLFENMLNGFAYCQMIFEQDQPQDFIYLGVNAAFETQTGLKNVAGRRVSEVLPGIRQSDPELFEIYGRVSLSGKPERFEIYLHALQQWFWISVYSPGKGYFVAVFDVITERKQAEEALHESEERYRLVQEKSMDAILLTAPDGTIYSANPAACAMLQRTEEEICQLGRDGLVDLHDPRLPVLLAERASTGSIKGELTMVRKDGSKFEVELSSSVFINTNGEKRTSMIIRDITERKLTEARLAEYTEELRRWHGITLGRELRNIELKREINELLIQVGQPPRYPSAEPEEGKTPDV